MPRIACVQTNVVFGNPAENVAHAVAKLKECKAQNVDLAIFPEAFLTGYAVDTEDEARSIALTATEAASDYEDAEENAYYMDDAIAELFDAVNELDILCIIGYAAETALGELVNEAVLLEPDVAPRVYRKTHLPLLGFDRFATPGPAIPVFETRIGTIGIGICFDLRHPELCRTLALQGADLIALPTNWPNAATVSATLIAPTRAAENRVFVATCDRIGAENGFPFVGLSGIFSPEGKTLLQAGDEDTILIADCDFAEARLKTTVTIPGKYETTVFASRRPELYDLLTEPNDQ